MRPYISLGRHRGQGAGTSLPRPDLNKCRCISADPTANLEAAMPLGLRSIIPRWYVIEIMSVWSLTYPNESFSAPLDVAYSTVIRSSKNSIHFTVKTPN